MTATAFIIAVAVGFVLGGWRNKGRDYIQYHRGIADGEVLALHYKYELNDEKEPTEEQLHDFFQEVYSPKLGRVDHAALARHGFVSN